MSRARFNIFWGLIAGIGVYLFGSRLVQPLLSQPSMGLSKDAALFSAIAISAAVFFLIGIGLKRLLVK